MTSSIKIGIIGLCIGGVGLGAYLVNRGLKNDPNVQNSTAGKVATNDATGANPATGTTGVTANTPAAPTPGAPVSPDDNAGRVASPPAWNLNEMGGDNERSFRPHTPETTVPPTAGGAGQGDTLRSDSPGTAGSTVTTPPPVAPSVPPVEPSVPPVEPSVPPVPTPAAPPSNNDQMGLRTVNPSAPGTVTPGPTTAQPAAPEKTTIHVVQKGDTLSALAAKYLGSTRYATLIAKANPNIKPNRLIIGAKLKIPAAPPAPTTAPAGTGTSGTATTTQKPKPVAPPVDPARAYTVKPNDSWTSLAKHFLGNDNWTILYEHNKDRFPKNSRTLRPGMVIEIPPKEPAKEAATPKK